MATRRLAIAALVGGAFGLIKGLPDEWIKVAHKGVNLNERSYSPEALATMEKAAKGIIVALAGDFEPPQLDELLGIVSEAKLEDGFVSVKVKWFSRLPIPVGKHLCPWGVGTLDANNIVLSDYKLESMRVHTESAFQNSSVIP